MSFFAIPNALSGHSVRRISDCTQGNNYSLAAYVSGASDTVLVSFMPSASPRITANTCPSNNECSFRVPTLLAAHCFAPFKVEFISLHPCLRLLGVALSPGMVVLLDPAKATSASFSQLLCDALAIHYESTVDEINEAVSRSARASSNNALYLGVGDKIIGCVLFTSYRLISSMSFSHSSENFAFLFLSSHNKSIRKNELWQISISDVLFTPKILHCESTNITSHDAIVSCGTQKGQKSGFAVAHGDALYYYAIKTIRDNLFAVEVIPMSRLPSDAEEKNRLLSKNQSNEAPTPYFVSVALPSPDAVLADEDDYSRQERIDREPLVIYALTRTGLLVCYAVDTRNVEKWVDCKLAVDTSGELCDLCPSLGLIVTPSHVCVIGINIIRYFTVFSWRFLDSLKLKELVNEADYSKPLSNYIVSVHVSLDSITLYIARRLNERILSSGTFTVPLLFSSAQQKGDKRQRLFLLKNALISNDYMPFERNLSWNILKSSSFNVLAKECIINPAETHCVCWCRDGLKVYERSTLRSVSTWLSNQASLLALHWCAFPECFILLTASEKGSNSLIVLEYLPRARSITLHRTTSTPVAAGEHILQASITGYQNDFLMTCLLESYTLVVLRFLIRETAEGIRIEILSSSSLSNRIDVSTQLLSIRNGFIYYPKGIMNSDTGSSVYDISDGYINSIAANSSKTVMSVHDPNNLFVFDTFLGKASKVFLDRDASVVSSLAVAQDSDLGLCLCNENASNALVLFSLTKLTEISRTVFFLPERHRADIDISSDGQSAFLFCYSDLDFFLIRLNLKTTRNVLAPVDKGYFSPTSNARDRIRAKHHDAIDGKVRTLVRRTCSQPPSMRQRRDAPSPKGPGTRTSAVAPLRARSVTARSSAHSLPPPSEAIDSHLTNARLEDKYNSLEVLFREINMSYQKRTQTQSTPPNQRSITNSSTQQDANNSNNSTSNNSTNNGTAGKLTIHNNSSDNAAISSVKEAENTEGRSEESNIDLVVVPITRQYDLSVPFTLAQHPAASVAKASPSQDPSEGREVSPPLPDRYGLVPDDGFEQHSPVVEPGTYSPEVSRKPSLKRSDAKPSPPGSPAQLDDQDVVVTSSVQIEKEPEHLEPQRSDSPVKSMASLQESEQAHLDTLRHLIEEARKSCESTRELYASVIRTTSRPGSREGGALTGLPTPKMLSERTALLNSLNKIIMDELTLSAMMSAAVSTSSD